jgi:hypothetical protein
MDPGEPDSDEGEPNEDESALRRTGKEAKSAYITARNLAMEGKTHSQALKSKYIRRLGKITHIQPGVYDSKTGNLCWSAHDSDGEEEEHEADWVEVVGDKHAGSQSARKSAW